MTAAEFFRQIFELPIGQLNMWQFGVMLLIIIALVALAVLLVIGIFKFLKTFFKILGNVFSAKKRCAKVQCPHCGRTLDKCLCANNKRRSYISRLYHYKKEQRQRKK